MENIAGRARHAYHYEEALFRTCIRTKDLSRGFKFHANLLRKGMVEKCFYPLLTMYAKCGAPMKANVLLQDLCVQDVVSWTEVIAGFNRQGQAEEALRCYDQMCHQGIRPNAMTFSSVLKACGSAGAIDMGEQIHDEISRQGLLEGDAVLGTALVDMYARLGALEKARRVLDQHPRGNIFSWTALIAGYAHYEQGDNAFLCFQQMQNEGISPDPMTFTCLLKAAGSMGALDRGEQVHQDIYKQGLLWNNATLVSALIDMYAKCGSFKKAEDILTTFEIQNIVAWSALIAGYVQHGQGEEAIKLYGRMQQKCIIPNVVTFTSILKACGSIQAVSTGEQIHNEIVQCGFFGRDMVLGNALVDMYIKCGALAKARRVFEELPAQDVVTWSALIAGYAEQGQDEEALQCYDQMQAHGLSPNAVTYTCILKVCGNTGLFGKGKQIHEQIVKSNLLADNLQLGTALLDFYVKCGALADAQEVLKCLPVQDSVACTALLAGYSRLGQAENALSCLRQMQQNGLSLTEVTSTCVLYAYSHSGLVDEGFTYFANMVTNDKVRLNMVHYSCLIDLFGRAGDLEKATALAETIPSLEHGFVWPTLLKACQKIKDVDVARWAFENAMQMDNFPSALFISMANMY